MIGGNSGLMVYLKDCCCKTREDQMGLSWESIDVLLLECMDLCSTVCGHTRRAEISAVDNSS